MKILKTLQAYHNLFPRAKNAGLGCLFLINALRLFCVLFLPVTVLFGTLYTTILLCLCYVALFVLTNTVSVKVFTKLHIFPRIAMTKKVLYKMAPELNLSARIESNVASTRSLLEEGLFGIILGALFFILSVVLSLYFSCPVGICALLCLLLLIPDSHRMTGKEEREFFDSALTDTENAEEKLSKFSSFPRQKMHFFRIDKGTLLRLVALFAACIGGKDAILGYIYFELSLYFLSLFKNGRNVTERELPNLEKIKSFLDADWPDAKQKNEAL